MKLKWVQAYKQVPWRAQIKWGSRFLMILAISAMVIGLYLSVSAQAAAIGIDIQRSEVAKDNLESEIADMRSQLALLTSEKVMENRAKELGFDFADLSNALYVAVPGYVDRLPANLASPYDPQIIAHPLLKPGYTQSLWEWLAKNALQLESLQQGEQS
jgi:hypothetical protein